MGGNSSLVTVVDVPRSGSDSPDHEESNEWLQRQVWWWCCRGEQGECGRNKQMVGTDRGEEDKRLSLELNSVQSLAFLAPLTGLP